MVRFDSPQNQVCGLRGFPMVLVLLAKSIYLAFTGLPIGFVEGGLGQSLSSWRAVPHRTVIADYDGLPLLLYSASSTEGATKDKEPEHDRLRTEFLASITSLYLYILM
jgi:hypothetical protein